MASSKRLSLSLPLELVEEIFCRVPIESLVRFKTTCKEWYALFNDKIFFYKHLYLSQERVIRVDRFNLNKSIQIFNPEKTEALLRLPIPDELRKGGFRKTIYCDGLLLSYCITATGDEKLAVWNPILRQVKWIEPSNSYKTLDSFGLGYDNVSRDNYKILRINQGELSSEIEIYEFKSKLWRSLDHAATLECAPLGYWHSKSASMNGNIYWTVRKRRLNSEIEIFIQSFDFSTETFKPICFVPEGIRYSSVKFDRLVLSGLGGDRLSLLHQDNHLKIEVWVTNKVTDGIVSWSKYFSTPPILLHPSSHHGRLKTYFLHKTNKIMLWCEDPDSDMCTNVYEMGDADEIEEQVEDTGRHISCYLSCNVYVPSLVPVPK